MRLGVKGNARFDRIVPDGCSLKAALLAASLSRAGNCYDNAALESFWGKLKSERVHRHDFATR